MGGIRLDLTQKLDLTQRVRSSLQIWAKKK